MRREEGGWRGGGEGEGERKGGGVDNLLACKSSLECEHLRRGKGSRKWRGGKKSLYYTFTQSLLIIRAGFFISKLGPHG